MWLTNSHYVGDDYNFGINKGKETTLSSKISRIINGNIFRRCTWTKERLLQQSEHMLHNDTKLVLKSFQH
jgi:hypothetical protein